MALFSTGGTHVFEGVQCIVALEEMVEERLERKDFHRALEWFLIADYFKNADPMFATWLNKAYEKRKELSS